MMGSAFFYAGAVIAIVGLALTVRPVAALHVTRRWHALVIMAVGTALAGVALNAPSFESRAAGTRARIDDFTPVWQFHEVHAIRIAAPPARVFDAIKHVRADEIFLFRTLVWIRRFGRPAPQTILDAAASRESIIDVATHSTFVVLADEAPRELVVGTVVGAPRGAHGSLTPSIFRARLPPGFALATMNFVVTPDGPNASYVTTETRVFANDAPSRRRFAAYWRMIYPGSALIRRMWLRAIERRATR
jgi:hypothetical protein